MVSGRWEVDLRFCHISRKRKDMLVFFFFLFFFFFNLPSILGFYHTLPPEPHLSASVNKCERLEVVPLAGLAELGSVLSK